MHICQDEIRLVILAIASLTDGAAFLIFWVKTVLTRLRGAIWGFRDKYKA